MEDEARSCSMDFGCITPEYVYRMWGGTVRMLYVEKDRWHSLECLESGSVLYSSKDGPYHPLQDDEILQR